MISTTSHLPILWQFFSAHQNIPKLEIYYSLPHICERKSLISYSCVISKLHKYRFNMLWRIYISDIVLYLKYVFLMKNYLQFGHIDLEEIERKGPRKNCTKFPPIIMKQPPCGTFLVDFEKTLKFLIFWLYNKWPKITIVNNELWYLDGFLKVFLSMN